MISYIGEKALNCIHRAHTSSVGVALLRRYPPVSDPHMENPIRPARIPDATLYCSPVKSAVLSPFQMAVLDRGRAGAGRRGGGGGPAPRGAGGAGGRGAGGGGGGGGGAE